MTTTEMTRTNGVHMSAPLITSEHRQILRGMIQGNATEPQIEMMMLVGNRYDLDPLLGHIALISGKVFVTHKGLMHKAHTSGQFDGLETVYGRDQQGDYCECRVFRKDMSRPMSGRIYLDEYRAAGPVWKQYPRAMAAKTAESFVLRRAFDVSLTSQEEMGVDAPQPSGASGGPHPQLAAPPPGTEDALVTERREKRERIVRLMEGLDAKTRSGWLDRFEQKYGIRNVKMLGLEELAEAADAVEGKSWPYEDKFEKSVAPQAVNPVTRPDGLPNPDYVPTQAEQVETGTDGEEADPFADPPTLLKVESGKADKKAHGDS